MTSQEITRQIAQMQGDREERSQMDAAKQCAEKCAKATSLMPLDAYAPVLTPIILEAMRGVVQPAKLPLDDMHLPLVSGRRIETSNNAFERACLVCLMHEQEKINADNALVNTLCEAVRLCREYNDAMKLYSPAPRDATDPVQQGETSEWKNEPEENTCLKCYAVFELREGCESTGYCDLCAQSMISEATGGTSDDGFHLEVTRPRATKPVQQVTQPCYYKGAEPVGDKPDEPAQVAGAKTMACQIADLRVELASVRRERDDCRQLNLGLVDANIRLTKERDEAQAEARHFANEVRCGKCGSTLIRHECPTCNFSNCCQQCCQITSLEEDVARLTTTNARMRAALEPFADHTERPEFETLDDTEILCGGYSRIKSRSIHITVGHFRAAKAARTNSVQVAKNGILEACAERILVMAERDELRAENERLRTALASKGGL